MKKGNCCICLNEKDIIYNCMSCKEGLVCWDCYFKLMISKGGEHNLILFEFKELKGIEKLKNLLSCPCCRSINWKYYYDEFLWSIIEPDNVIPDDNRDIPVIKKYLFLDEN